MGIPCQTVIDGGLYPCDLKDIGIVRSRDRDVTPGGILPDVMDRDGPYDGAEMRHHTNELSFERPDWLIDRTHHMFAVAPHGPSPFNIVLSHSEVGDESLGAIVERLLRELGSTLDGFVAGTQETATVAGLPAVIIQFQWKQGEQPLYQRQAVLIREKNGTRTLHQIAATASGDAQQRHVMGFGEMLATIRFRDEEGDGRTS